MLSNQVSQLINEQINKDKLLETLKFEEYVTVSINNVYDIKEHGEEGKNEVNLIKKYELFREDGKDFYILNQALSSHVYIPSSLVI